MKTTWPAVVGAHCDMTRPDTERPSVGLHVVDFALILIWDLSAPRRFHPYATTRDAHHSAP